jgi:N-acyl-D-amino-acid deacylase
VTSVDLVIRNGLLIDGTGTARRRADIGIAADRIVAVGQAERSRRAREIDATDRIVAPGFVDAHTHDDRALLSMPDMTPKVSQGVTTVVAGNCGVSLAPLALDGVPPPPLDLLGSEAGWFRFDRFGALVETLGESPPAPNCALLVGHITLRHRVMGGFDRAASPGELGEMTRQVAAAMAAGAIGLSTGLDYPSAVAASTEEVRALVAAVRPYGGLYCSHHRS